MLGEKNIRGIVGRVLARSRADLRFTQSYAEALANVEMVGQEDPLRALGLHRCAGPDAENLRFPLHRSDGVGAMRSSLLPGSGSQGK